MVCRMVAYIEFTHLSNWLDMINPSVNSSQLLKSDDTMEI